MSRDGGGDGVGTYTGSIPVCVKGTIKSSQYVTVSVSTPTLTCEDGTTAAVSLSQPKDTWTCDEVAGDGTTASFAVSTELAQPGDWSGTATFGCEMGSTGPVIIEFYKMKYTAPEVAATYYAEEGMTWREWVASEYNTDGYKIVIADVGCVLLGTGDIGGKELVVDASDSTTMGYALLPWAEDNPYGTYVSIDTVITAGMKTKDTRYFWD